MANVRSPEWELDTADTYRFDMPFAEDKQNWVRQFTDVADKVKVLEKHSIRVAGGYIVYCCHYSAVLNRQQSFCVFLPLLSQLSSVPQIYFLPGINCDKQLNSALIRRAAYWGIAIVFDNSPADTSDPFYQLVSPCSNMSAGDGCPTASSGQFFYIDTAADCQREEPESKSNYRMKSYILNELRVVVTANFPVRYDAMSIMGFKTGGLGALVISFENPDTFRSASALSPICHPQNTKWGTQLKEASKQSEEMWDLIHLLENTADTKPDVLALIQKNDYLIDIADNSASSDDSEIRTLAKHAEAFQKCCDQLKVNISCRIHDGYDNSFLFVQSFIDCHLDHHAKFLCPTKYSQRMLNAKT